MMKLKSRAAYRLVFENPVMGKMLNMVPGLRELLLLGKAWFTEQSVDEDGEPTWDAIVMDAPATGHSISLFRLPRVILSLMKVGPMASDAEEILQLLTDANRCSFWIVTLPEELPFNECMELSKVNEEELHLPLDHVVVNQCWDHLISDSLMEGEKQASTFREVKGFEETVEYMESRVKEQEKYAKELESEYGSRCVRLPFLPEQPLGSEELQGLAEHLASKLALLN
jgi:anion-transporting  ArsA/GET3 family ATPase